ncbi:uncharacterized protein LOC119368539 [Triticum dicoccoides]|uniref:uncharacterized protein LOC119368539 n=1 Tax=Triticum dicoccoides TaxID=85692 RepID=UPI000E7A8D9D|nr:uncharacterized protein LOC119368539 [Triticum dicoccoides]
MPSGTSSSPGSARIEPVFDLQSPSFDASIHSVLLLLSPQRPFLRLSVYLPWKDHKLFIKLKDSPSMVCDWTGSQQVDGWNSNTIVIAEDLITVELSGRQLPAAASRGQGAVHPCFLESNGCK